VGEPGKQVPPEELYEKLKPFEDRVAADIEARRDDEGDARPPDDQGTGGAD